MTALVLAYSELSGTDFLPEEMAKIRPKINKIMLDNH